MRYYRLLFDVGCYVLAIVPKGIKGVDVACFLVEDVNDDVAVVNANPTAFRCTFVANGKTTELFQSCFQVIEKRLYLWSGTTGANNKVVGNIGHAFDFHNFDIQCGFVTKGFAN